MDQQILDGMVCDRADESRGHVSTTSYAVWCGMLCENIKYSVGLQIVALIVNGFFPSHATDEIRALVDICNVAW